MFGLMLAQVSGAWGSAFGSGTNKSVLHNILNTLLRVLSALFPPTFVGGGHVHCLN